LTAATIGVVSRSGGTEAFVEVTSPSMAVVARGLSWKGLTLIVGQGSWYASLAVLAIILPPAAFGIVAVGTAVTAVTALLMDAGTAGTIVATPQVGAAYVRRAVIRTAITGIALAALGAALAGPIADTFAAGGDADVLRAMMVTIALAGFTIVPNALLEKTLRFKRVAMIAIAATVIASAAAILAAILGAGVWALVLRLVVNQLVTMVLVWVSALPLLPRGEKGERPLPVRRGASWFVVLGAAAFGAHTFDNVIVGHLTDVTQLGLYAMAFALAFAPLRQVSWQVGAVLFPSIAATQDPAAVARRTLKSLRLMALVLLPLVAPGVALAPGLIPAVLGEEWTGMILPFQILLAVGVGQGLVNILGETLAARNIAVRGRIEVIWAVAVLGGIAAGTEVGGINGAALAHLVAFCGLAGAYLWFGTRAIELSAGRVIHAVRGVVACVAVQAIVTAMLIAGVGAAGGGALTAGSLAAMGGLTVMAPLLWATQRELLRDGRDVFAAALLRRRGLAEA
jgi:teichuronic acid exporter